MASFEWPPTGGSSGGSGTVTSVSVVSANGLAGTVATATTTPAITLSTTVTGVLKGDGTTISAATSGTDYSAGTSALATGILKNTTGTGALTIAVAGDFPTLPYISTTLGATATSGGLAVSGNALSAAQSSGSQNGWLSSTDWTTFNSKQTAGTYVTAVSVASSNGFTGSSSGGATPALTIATSITGVIKGNGTAISAATSGTDYSAGTSALATGILKSTTSTGALSIATAGTDYVVPSGSITGTAASVTGTNVVTNSNLSQMAANTLKGNNTGSTANAADLTVSQVNTMLGTLSNPMTTLGDMIYENATPAPARLAIGTTGQVLQVTPGGIMGWVTPNFAIGTSSSTRSTAVTSTTFTQSSSGPTVSITPTRTGTFRVRGILTLAGSVSVHATYCRIEGTAGSPAVVFQGISDFIPEVSGGYEQSTPVESYYTLTAGTAYTFAPFIKVDSGGSGTINNDSVSGAVLVVEEMF